jgi:hypothetical protein
MASALQIKANQENARRSTGPRTPEGKARSSLNARRHGLLARDAVLPDEDRAAYLELLAALEAEHRPEGPTRTFLVHQLASAQWRLQRLLRIEAGLFFAGLESVRSAGCGEAPSRREGGDRYDENTRLLGLLFFRNCNGDSFIKLARYETMLNREYYRALKALTDARRPTPPARSAPRPQLIDERPAPSGETNPILPTPEHRPGIHEHGGGPALAYRGFRLRTRPPAA